jgi:DNA-binding CsgD family transcriptional regulator
MTLGPDSDRDEIAMERLRRRVFNDSGHRNGWHAQREHEHAVMPSPDPRPLTAHERRVIAGLAAGLSRQETAVALNVSVESIKNALTFAKRKLRAKTTAQLTANAVREHVIP